MEAVNNFLFYGVFFGYLFFVLVYGIGSPWWKSEMGVHIMSFMAVFFILMALGIVKRLSGDAWFDAHQVVLKFISFLLMFATVWWRNVILVRAQQWKGDLPSEVQRAHGARPGDQRS